MTRLAVVGYPQVTEADRAWIESVRSRHDPQASRIGAHFTLVFPAALALDTIVGHASTIAPLASAIPFVLRSVRAVPEALAGGGHVFLLPDEGGAAITALHDLLYDGPLRAFHRDDLPFVPHVTVGASPDLAHCEEIRREVDGAMRPIEGTIRSLDVVEIGDDGIRTATRLDLTGR